MEEFVGESDILSQLEQKEHDLQMAAEFGKLLVQQNEELMRKNEQMMEEYHQKFEALKQEKYQLKLQLECVISESRLAEAEHRADLEDLQWKFDDAQKRAQVHEHSHKEIIKELTQQNERLTEQLLTDIQAERELHEHVNSSQLSVSVISDDDDLSDEVEALKQKMADMKTELELRLALKTEECDTLACDLEKTNLKLSALDSETASITEKLKHMEDDLHRQEDINMQLLLNLENISLSAAVPNTSTHEKSLFAELELLSTSLSVNSFNNQPAKQITIGTQMKQEILEVFRQLKRLTLEVQGRADEWSPEAVDITDLHAGQLLTSLTDLQSLVHQQLQGSTSSTHMAEIQVLQRQIASLKEQLVNSQSRSGTLEAELLQRDRQLIHKCDELKLIETQLAACNSELSKLRKEKDKVMDEMAGIITVDDALRAARAERDHALQCCDDLQQQLVTLQLDYCGLDRQLLDAVSQKLKLSQQLEAWQNDMQDLIASKMADEIARDHMKFSAAIDGASSSSSRDKSNRKRFGLHWTST